MAIGFLICCVGSGVFGWQIRDIRARMDERRRFERSIRRFDSLCDFTRHDQIIDLRDGRDA